MTKYGTEVDTANSLSASLASTRQQLSTVTNQKNSAVNENGVLATALSDAGSIAADLSTCVNDTDTMIDDATESIDSGVLDPPWNLTRQRGGRVPAGPIGELDSPGRTVRGLIGVARATTCHLRVLIQGCSAASAARPGASVQLPAQPPSTVGPDGSARRPLSRLYGRAERVLGHGLRPQLPGHPLPRGADVDREMVQSQGGWQVVAGLVLRRPHRGPDRAQRVRAPRRWVSRDAGSFRVKTVE